MATSTQSSPSIKSRLAATFKPYQWGFIGFLILAALIPKIYELTNTFWIGQISYNALAITEQYEFLGVTIEIVNEMIPFGILALVAQNFTNKEKIASILKSGIILQIIFSSILMSIVMFFTPQFVSTIGTPTEIVSLTSNYLLLKAIALPFDSVAILLLIAIKAHAQRQRRTLPCALLSHTQHHTGFVPHFKHQRIPKHGSSRRSHRLRHLKSRFILGYRGIFNQNPRHQT